MPNKCVNTDYLIPPSITNTLDVSSLPPAHNSKVSAPINIKRVRAIFCRPGKVAASSFLRREIASRMYERLALIKIDPQRVMDAGCGEGADLPLLKKRYQEAQVLAVDASFNMLQVAQEHQKKSLTAFNRLMELVLAGKNGSGSEADLIHANFDQLPFSASAIDMVWSNLALHWHPQPDLVFAEWRRVLRVDGLLMFSCFGPDTFKEVRSAFAEVDGMMHALPFVDMHDYGDMLGNVGFSAPVMDMEVITVTYDSVNKLFADIRAFGGNPSASRMFGLMGRVKWRKVAEKLDALRRPDGKIPLTFEIIYGHAFRPVSKVTAKGEAIIRLELPPKRK